MENVAEEKLDMTLLSLSVITLSLFSLSFAYYYPEHIKGWNIVLYYAEGLASLLIVNFVTVKITENTFNYIGITKRKLGRSLIEGLIGTVLIIIYLYIVGYAFSDFLFPKKVLMTYPLFSKAHIILVLAVVFSAIVHEIIARGMILSTLDTGEGGIQGWIAIIGSSLMFLIIYYYISLSLVFLMFIPSIIWGKLYIRTHNIFGVMLSHIIINLWLIYSFGFFGFVY